MKSTINKQQLFIEFFSVVFAVILALILNSWRESSALADNVEKVKEAIKKEAIRNDTLIQKSHKYRKELLNKFYSNKNLLTAIPVADFPLDVNDNDALTKLFKSSLIFGQKKFYERVLVMQDEDNRVLILDNNVFDLRVENDTLKLLGVGNIQLKTPDLSYRSWQLAQATNTIVEMDIELVENLSVLNALIDSYLSTSDKALQMIYSENQKGLLSVIEDMYSQETKILKANNSLLLLLQ